MREPASGRTDGGTLMRERAGFAAWAAAVLAASGLVAAESASSDVTARLVDAGLRSNGSYATLAGLTDRIGPRLSGSENLQKAVAWATQEMRRVGLDRVWTEPVTVPHWVRGEESGKILAPAEHPLVLLALGMSDGTPPEGITADVVEATTLDEARSLGDRVKGKIVLYNRKIYPNGDGERGYGYVAGIRGAGASTAAPVDFGASYWNPAVISALALGLLHPSQPALPVRLGTSRPCQLPICGRMIVDVQIDPYSTRRGDYRCHFIALECSG